MYISTCILIDKNSSTVELPLLGHIGPARFCPNKACVPIIHVFVFPKHLYARSIYAPTLHYVIIIMHDNNCAICNSHFPFKDFLKDVKTNKITRTCILLFT